MKRIHSLLLAATALAGAGFAQSAAAQSTEAYLAGGARLPSYYYTQALNCYGGTDQMLHVNNNSDENVTDYAGCTGTENPDLSLGYVTTGSGRGIEGYIANNVSRYLYIDKSSDPGFQVVAQDGSLVTLTSEAPLFSGSDAALTTAQLTALTSTGATANVQGTVGIRAAADTNPANGFPNFVTNYGAPVQVPALYAAVAVAFKPTYRDANGVEQTLPLPGGRLTLTKTQVCQIFNGDITNFSQLDPSLPNVNIQLVGRSDNSGTTELFTRFLFGQGCVGYTTNENPTWTAEGSQTLPAFYAPLFVRASGNKGVAAAINYSPATPVNTIRIGYLSNDYLSDAANGLNFAHPGTSWAGLGITAARIKNNGIAYDPKPEDLATAVSAVGFTAPNTDAARANPANWVPLAANSSIENPGDGYPIIGTSNFLVYSCYATEARKNAATGYFNWFYAAAEAGELIHSPAFLTVGEYMAIAILETFFSDSGDLAVGVKGSGSCASLPGSGA